MTPLELALTDVEEMNGYLETTTTEDIIKDILSYHNADRTVIATSVLCGLSSAWLNENVIGWSRQALVKESVLFADFLIAELKK